MRCSHRLTSGVQTPPTLPRKFVTCLPAAYVFQPPTHRCQRTHHRSIFSGIRAGRLGTPEARTHNFIVPVTVVNHGDATAEGVRLEVLMEKAETEPARCELTIPFLPRRATREGFVTFQQDPRAAQLKARVLGYEKP